MATDIKDAPKDGTVILLCRSRDSLSGYAPSVVPWKRIAIGRYNGSRRTNAGASSSSIRQCAMTAAPQQGGGARAFPTSARLLPRETPEPCPL